MDSRFDRWSGKRAIGVARAGMGARGSGTVRIAALDVRLRHDASLVACPASPKRTPGRNAANGRSEPKAVEEFFTVPELIFW